jgi:hypothetical protein
MSIYSEFLNFHRNIYTSGHTTDLHNGKVIKIKVHTKTNSSKGYHEPEYNDLLLVSGSIKMSYEALIPLFALSGHEYRVLLFIIAYCAKREDNTFYWDDMVASEYMTLYQIAAGKKVKPETIRLALHKLTKLHIVQKIKKEHYLLNPLYSARVNNYSAKNIFNSFLARARNAGISIQKALFMSKGVAD